MNDELYETGSNKLVNPFRARVGTLNLYSFWCFVVGVTLLLLFAGVNYQASSKESPQPERMVITVEDNKGIITKIFEGSFQKTAAGPDVVMRPYASPTTAGGGSQSTNSGTGAQPAGGKSDTPTGTNK
jgi:hypothetical protein